MTGNLPPRPTQGEVANQKLVDAARAKQRQGGESPIAATLAAGCLMVLFFSLGVALTLGMFTIFAAILLSAAGVFGWVGSWTWWDAFIVGCALAVVSALARQVFSR